MMRYSCTHMATVGVKGLTASAVVIIQQAAAKAVGLQCSRRRCMA